MEAEQILAFRLARSGLARRAAGSLAAAAACPASDVARDAALLSLAARLEGVTRAACDEAVDAGKLVVAHLVRGAIHALTPDDLARYGRGLVAEDDDELAVQLGPQFQRVVAAGGVAPTAALAQVTHATRASLARGRRLSKNELHEALRARVDPALMPWCNGCKSHHVAPMLWRYATVEAGVRLDSSRRYLLGRPGRLPPPSTAVVRLLHFYGPSTVTDFAAWTGIARPHAKRLWAEAEGDLAPVGVGTRVAWVASADAGELESPAAAAGIRLIPPGDPYLQTPNRALLAPEAGLRTRLFRPVASPSAVLREGRLVGIWRVRTRGRKAVLSVEKLAGLARRELDEEAQRLADLRGAAELALELA